MNWTSAVTSSILESWNVQNFRVPLIIHPWEIDQEELALERANFEREVSLWESSNVLFFPTSEDVQMVLRPSPYLTTVGPGISFYRQGSLQEDKQINSSDNVDESLEMPGSPIKVTSHLVPTTTTCRNLSLLGAAMCQEPHPPPILLCGPHGSGKSSLIRELLRLCRPNETLIEFHIDEETDSKTLIGSYTTTDIPGEFAWRAGALTHATREGRWVLIEDLDTVPVEIQAALVKLFEERMLPLGGGKYERCHPDFRIFATCATNAVALSSVQGKERRTLRLRNHRGGGKQILNPSYWRTIHVKPLPFSELKDIALALFPDIPDSIIDSSISLLQSLDRSGRTHTLDNTKEKSYSDFSTSNEARMALMWTGGRIPSVRDLFKLLFRISNGICFEKNSSYITEAQRTLCMAESVDVFVGSCPDQQVKEEFIGLIAAPAWSITKDLALKYIETREPQIFLGPSLFQIGRVKIDMSKSLGFSSEKLSTFAQTSHALRFMESLAVCVRENEPALLVGYVPTFLICCLGSEISCLIFITHILSQGNRLRQDNSYSATFRTL
jgi:midasin